MVMVQRGNLGSVDFFMYVFYHSLYIHVNRNVAASIPSLKRRGFTRPLIIVP
jgi:hypothetical protein